MVVEMPPWYVFQVMRTIFKYFYGINGNQYIFTGRRALMANGPLANIVNDLGLKLNKIIVAIAIFKVKASAIMFAALFSAKPEKLSWPIMKAQANAIK